ISDGEGLTIFHSLRLRSNASWSLRVLVTRTRYRRSWLAACQATVTSGLRSGWQSHARAGLGATDPPRRAVRNTPPRPPRPGPRLPFLYATRSFKHLGPAACKPRGLGGRSRSSGTRGGPWRAPDRRLGHQGEVKACAATGAIALGPDSATVHFHE